MAAYVPDRAAVRQVLDRDADAKSPSRSARELVERSATPDDEGLTSISPRLQRCDAPLALRQRQLAGELPAGVLETFQGDNVHVCQVCRSQDVEVGAEVADVEGREAAVVRRSPRSLQGRIGVAA